MTPTRRLLPGLGALALIAWLQPSAADACSVCQPGDPIFSGEGASAQRAGSFNLYLEAQQLRKRSGSHPHHGEEAHDDGHEEAEHDAPPVGRDVDENLSRELNLFASWTPVDRLTLTARVPFKAVSIEQRRHDGPSETSRNSGLGDVSLFGTAVLWRNRDVLPSTQVEGRLMVEVPTGTDRERIDGVLDPHLQLGSGSWDWGLGLAASHKLTRNTLYASVFYRFNREGALDYEYGDVFLANLAVTSDALHLGGLGGSGLRGGSELNLRYAGADHVAGTRYRDSGGSMFYVSPFLELRLVPGRSERVPWLRLAARLPLGSGGLNGYQREDYVYSVGLRYGF